MCGITAGRQGVLGDSARGRQANSWEEVTPSGTGPPAVQYMGMVWCDAEDGFYIFGGRTASGAWGGEANAATMGFQA